MTENKPSVAQQAVLGLGNITTTVEVSGNSQEVTIPTPQGRLKIGTVVSETFETKGVKKHYFISNGAVGGKQKAYSLGPTSDAFQFVDHSAAISPFTDQGYEVTRAMYARGGMTAVFQLTHPQARELLDPIMWDIAMWPTTDVHGKELPKTLRESLMVTTSIKPGKGLWYRRGLLRMVCTNGLMSEILKMGSARFSHSAWKADTVAKAMLNSGWGMPDDSIVRGPFIGTVKGVNRLLPVLQAAGQEGGQELLDRMPAFLQDLFSPIINMPSWFLGGLTEQFQLMTQLDSDQQLHALDIVNAITSPVSVELKTEAPRQTAKIYTRIDALTQSVSNLVGSLSL